MDRSVIQAQLIALAVLAATVLPLTLGVDVSLVDRPGITMRMPARAGNWSGEQVVFCHVPHCRRHGPLSEATAEGGCPSCDGPLFPMSWDEKEILPADTEFLRYRYRNAAGSTLLAAIVLSGAERDSIHRPQRCLVGQGFQIVGAHTIALDLPRAEPLHVRRLDTLFHVRRGPELQQAVPTQYAYWFVGQDRETPSHLARMFWLAWDRIFRGKAHRWAYLIVQGPSGGSPEHFETLLADFLPAWYPAVLTPDTTLLRSARPQ